MKRGRRDDGGGSEPEKGLSLRRSHTRKGNADEDDAKAVRGLL